MGYAGAHSGLGRWPGSAGGGGGKRTQQNNRRRRNYWKAQSQEGMVVPWSLPSTEVSRRRTKNRTPLASRGLFRVSFHVSVAERCPTAPETGPTAAERQEVGACACAEGILLVGL